MDVRWRIEMLGGLRVVLGDRVLTHFRTQKTGALLAYLAYYSQRSHLRDALIELFWPDGHLSAGRNNLSRELSWLRQQLEPPGMSSGTVIAADRAAIRLNPDAITTDVAAFEAALQSAERAASPTERAPHLAEAIETYGGELLSGYYDDWIMQEREWLVGRYFQALGQLLGSLEQAGELACALEYARRGVRADPLREETRRDLIRLLAAAGQSEAALRQYRELERRLKHELDAEPAAATRALARQIEAGQAAHPDGSSRSPTLPAAPPSEQPTRNLPEGTVTFLFTDIESSTRLWEEQPEAMRAALPRHDRLLHHAIESQGGAVFKTMGDQCCAAFATAPAALDAALAAQRALHTEAWGAAGELRVRMALHTGTAQELDGDYFGPPLNRIARLLATGQGGQILLSLATVELVRDQLPESADLRDLGAHRLPDLTRPEPIFQLVVPDLPATFPPLRTLEAFRHNLPVQLTSFIGREREVAQVKQFLATTRLLTLTGSGGCGKTRLAVQVAADLLEEYPEGVWLAELAPLADPALVPQAVASTLRVHEQPGRPLTETLVDYLKPKALLLVLDNCEHLLAACAQLAEGLLRACPQLRILASSREGLGIAGERTYRVPSLSLPAPGHEPPVERLMEYEGVRLFVERAVFIQPRFALTAQNAVAVAQVCKRLDGIPLAIELAAARVKALPVAKLNERLDDMFRLLTGGSRTALPRHQMLRALIDWSYDLLSEPERALLRRLSVFAGGWTLEAAEVVCAGEGIEVWEVLDRLTALVEKSLVQYEAGEVEARYRLLETVRQYGVEKLRGSGEEVALRGRHRDWFLELVEQAAPALRGAAQGKWLVRLEEEHENLRAALDWSSERGEGEPGLRLGGALWRFWEVRGYWTEGRARLTRLLALAGAEARTAARAKGLNGAGILAGCQGDYQAARALYEESLAIQHQLGDQHGIATSLNNLGEAARGQGDYTGARALHEESLAIQRELGDQQGIAISLTGVGVAAMEQGDYETARALYEESLVIRRQLGDQRGIAALLNNLGITAMERGDYEAARALYEESLAIRCELGDQQGIATSLNNLGNVACDQGDYGAAQARYEESLAIRRELGYQQGIASSLNNLGNVAWDQGDYGAARARYEESLAIYRELGYQQGIASSLNNLGLVAQEQGDYGAARARYEESLAICRQLGDKRVTAHSLESLAALAGAQDQPERGAHLFGAAEALREAMGTPLAPSVRADYERDVAAARATLAEEAFAAAWEAGRALSLDDAVAFALDQTQEG